MTGSGKPGMKASQKFLTVTGMAAGVLFLIITAVFVTGIIKGNVNRASYNAAVAKARSLSRIPSSAPVQSPLLTLQCSMSADTAPSGDLNGQYSPDVSVTTRGYLADPVNVTIIVFNSNGIQQGAGTVQVSSPLAADQVADAYSDETYPAGDYCDIASVNSDISVTYTNNSPLS